MIDSIKNFFARIMASVVAVVCGVLGGFPGQASVVDEGSGFVPLRLRLGLELLPRLALNPMSRLASIRLLKLFVRPVVVQTGCSLLVSWGSRRTARVKRLQPCFVDSGAWPCRSFLSLALDGEARLGSYVRRRVFGSSALVCQSRSRPLSTRSRAAKPADYRLLRMSRLCALLMLLNCVHAFQEISGHRHM